MYYIVKYLVLLCYSISSSSAQNVPKMTKLNITQESQNITTDEFAFLLLQVNDLTNGIVSTNCNGSCSVNSRNIEMMCHIMEDYSSLRTTTVTNVTRNDSGLWKCTFSMVKADYPPQEQVNGTQISYISFQQTVTFRLNVLFAEPMHINWVYIIVGTAILVLLIIIGQAICIIYFKRKANANQAHANLSKRNTAGDDIVRYSKMPVLKPKVDPCTEARESGIYEMLENVQAAAKPPPPSLETLPRDKKTQKSKPPVLVPSDTTSDNIPRSLTNGVPLPFRGLLPKNKTTPANPENTERRSSQERIRKRLPLPIPTEEEHYEVMPSTGSMSALNNSAVLNRDFNSRLKLSQQPMNYHNGSQTLQPQLMPSQLKEALKKRLNTTESTAKVASFNPGLPPPIATTPNQAPRPPWIEKQLPPQPNTPKKRPIPPSKPKQLKPLPPPPEQEINHQTPTDEYSEWDDEWNEENLYDV